MRHLPVRPQFVISRHEDRQRQDFSSFLLQLLTKNNGLLKTNYISWRRRDVAQPGRALRSGRRSRAFESRHPDHLSPNEKVPAGISRSGAFFLSCSFFLEPFSRFLSDVSSSGRLEMWLQGARQPEERGVLLRTLSGEVGGQCRRRAFLLRPSRQSSRSGISADTSPRSSRRRLRPGRP